MLEKFEKKMKIEGLKYLVSKFMFCPYSNKVLDYRNAIEVSLYDDQNNLLKSTVIHGSFESKIPEIKAKFQEKGLKIEVFKNITKKN